MEVGVLHGNLRVYWSLEILEDLNRDLKVLNGDLGY